MLNVLVIDDERSNLDLLKTLIQRSCNASIKTAHSAREALSEIESAVEKFDLIVCDYEMPEAHGTRVLEVLNQKKIPSYFLLWTQAVIEEIPELGGPFYLGAVKKSDSRQVCSILSSLEGAKTH